MHGDAKKIVVTPTLCGACSTHTVQVFHHRFPEMRVEGMSAKQAAEHLAHRLMAALDAVSDPSHREAVRSAIEDTHVFIELAAEPETTMSMPQSKLSEVIDVRGAGAAAPGSPSTVLAKTATLEVRRLTLASGREIPPHHTRGEITVHCLEGRIAFTADGTTRELGPGQLIVLAAGEPHSLVGLEDSSVLVTKVRLTAPLTHG